MPTPTVHELSLPELAHLLPAFNALSAFHQQATGNTGLTRLLGASGMCICITSDASWKDLVDSMIKFAANAPELPTSTPTSTPPPITPCPDAPTSPTSPPTK